MDDAIRKGEVIGGQYRVEEILGIGAMGIVYAAHDLPRDERVAIKVLRHELAAYPHAVKRFAQEAQTAARIKNEHVTRVFAIGELPDRTPYIVMEALEGEDLGRRIAKRGPLRVDEAAAFVLQACEALAEAHALGIAHRDLKPSNLFCAQRPDGGVSIKVLDFGTSKIAPLATPSSDIGRTSARTAVGSPYYMSPEQMQSAPDVDHRSDIWALGVILFELLTREVPFDGSTLPEVCIKVATRAPRSLRALRNDVPADVEATISKCLEKEPARRFQSVAELAGSLFPFAGRGARSSIDRIVQISYRTGGNAGLGDSASAPPRFLSERPTIRPLGATVPPAPIESSRKHVWVGLGGAALVALGVILFWTRPVGNGQATRIAEPGAAPTGAAAQPRVDRAIDLPSGQPATGELETVAESVSARGEQESAAPRAESETAPPAATGIVITLDEEQDEAEPRPRELPLGARTRPHKAAPRPVLSSEPGVDLRRPRPPGRTRELDESDPYTR